MKTKRLQILENSLIKKNDLFDEKLNNHFETVKQANGQPLNDKRNGQATLNKWDRQNESLLNLKENIEKSILDFIGVLGMSKTGLHWVKTGKDFAIISVNRESIDNIRASFTVFSEKITVEKVSGTLKRLKKK